MVFLLFFFTLFSTIALGGESCESDSDCLDLNSCEDEECKHKDIWPLEGIEYGGSLVIILMSAMANSAGIGGGPIMIPILLLLFFFHTEDAIPMAQTIILGGSLLAAAVKVWYRHPRKNRPLVSYNIMMHIQSTMLLGTTFGVLINSILPDWLILILLTILLIYLTINTGLKEFLYRSYKTYKNENQQKKKRVEEENQDFEKQNEDIEELNEKEKKGEETETFRLNPELEDYIQAESKTFPLVPLIIIFSIYFFVILASFMKGDGGNSIIGIEECSDEYWIFTVFFVLIIFLINAGTGLLLIKQTQKLEQLGYEFDEQDILWTYKKTFVISLVGIVAGTISGAFGLGGGVIVGPILLHFNVNPEISAATSSVMVFFTSSTSVINFGLAGRIKYDYAVLLIFLSITGSLLGVFFLKKMVKKTGRPSLLIMSLALILGVAAVMVPSYGISRIVEDEEEGEADYSFKELC